MSDPRMNTPAAVMLVVTGAILAAVSLPYVIAEFREESIDFQVLLTQLPAGSGDVNVNGGTLEASADVTVTSARPASATVEFTVCNDEYQPQLYEAASITWTLANASGELASGTFTCATGLPETANVTLAELEIEDIGANDNVTALQRAWSKLSEGNRTDTYTLTLVASRQSTLPPLPVGPPVGAPSLDVQARLTVHTWHVDSVQPKPEVVR